MEAPGTAPGSATLISQAVYRHSRLPDTPNIGALTEKDNLIAGRAPPIHSSARGKLRMGLGCERFVEIADQIFGGFEADREADDVGARPGRHALLIA